MKKFISIMLVLLLTLGLMVGCAGGDNGGVKNGGIKSNDLKDSSATQQRWLRLPDTSKNVCNLVINPDEYSGGSAGNYNRLPLNLGILDGDKKVTKTLNDLIFVVESKSANGVVVVMAESANPNPGTSQTPGTETPGTETPGTETPGQTTEQPADNGQRITSIILAEDDAEVYLGTPYKLEFDAYPKAYAASETYTWTSSNESIATVDSNGVVTGVAVGETTVTIKGSKSGITASCKVTVKLKEAESISLSHAAVTLNIGTTATLIATVTPADASETITWSSNFPNIVSVNPIDSRSAVIASLANGTAIITASTSSGKTATCSVASGITGYDIDPGPIEGSIRKAVQSLGERYGLQVIDLYALTEGHPEYFDDGVHPNTEGNRVIADHLLKEICL